MKKKREVIDVPEPSEDDLGTGDNQCPAYFEAEPAGFLHCHRRKGHPPPCHVSGEGKYRLKEER